MSATTEPAKVSTDVFAKIIAAIEKQFSTLAADELAAVKPALTTFLTWVAANPNGALNPVLVMPMVLKLQADLLAAQPAVAKEFVQWAANSILAAL